MHNYKAILFKCIDFRITAEITRWLKEKELMGDCDIVSLAGASKELVDGGARELLLKQISISQKLHQADTVVLLHHSDCGAYKNVYNFASDEEEKKQQFSDMAKAAEIIKNRFPEMKVRKVWAKLLDDHGGKIQFVEEETVYSLN